MPATSAPDTFCEVNVAPVAALMADSARAMMLVALLDDRPLAAGELARVAGVTPATASAHLARLLHGGLVVAHRQGRHRYYRLAGHDVAQAIEALAHLGTSLPVRSLRHSQDAAALDSARTCYDHLAGRAGVALFAALLDHGLITRHAQDVPPEAETGPAIIRLTPDGEAALAAFGIDLGELRTSRRRFVGECLDWTQRRSHLNGAVGAALTARFFELGWIERGKRRRAVLVTPAGAGGLAATFGCSLDA
jgi:DNA-binding transcriptional ArsR family regulator